jgi:pre-mRNA-splicing factor RBM22/SLT11
MLDLQFGLPIQVRDAALKLVKEAPTSERSRIYQAENQKKLLDSENPGEVAKEYGRTESAARELLKKLARSKPYARKPEATTQGAEKTATSGKKQIAGTQRSAGASRPTVSDLIPPADQSITSLFLLGVEEDLPEYAIRQHFSKYGPIKSLVCSHRARCAFVNFKTRKAAEEAATACAGDVLIQGCPLRVQWGKPRQLGGHGTEKVNAAMANAAVRQGQAEKAAAMAAQEQEAAADQSTLEPALPPGQSRPVYQSMLDEED